jgi:hypothetical protein
MAYEVSQFNPAKRAAAKQASRDEDARKLASGEISKEALRRRNGFFSGLDKSKFRMVAIGNMPIRRPDKQDDII